MWRSLCFSRLEWPQRTAVSSWHTERARATACGTPAEPHAPRAPPAHPVPRTLPRQAALGLAAWRRSPRSLRKTQFTGQLWGYRRKERAREKVGRGQEALGCLPPQGRADCPAELGGVVAPSLSNTVSAYETSSWKEKGHQKLHTHRFKSVLHRTLTVEAGGRPGFGGPCPQTPWGHTPGWR